MKKTNGESILQKLNEVHPVRRSRKEKADFRAFISERLGHLGVRTETTSDGKNENLVIGDPTSAKVVLTAHYDTPAASLFPNLMIPRNLPLFWFFQFLPVFLLLGVSLLGGFAVAQIAANGDSTVFLLGFLVFYYALYFLGFRVFPNRRNANDNTSGVATLISVAERLTPDDLKTVAFVFFDNEEKGKKGSKAYAKDHREAMKTRLVLNFDCVGNGEHVVWIAKKDAEAHELFPRLKETVTAAKADAFTVQVYPMRCSESNSDYKSFPCGVGCMVCKKNRFGVLYTPRIHTAADIVANDENVAFLAETVGRFLREIRAESGEA